MTIFNVLKGYLHKDDRQCGFIQTIITSISNWLEKFNDKLVEFYSNFYFDRLTINGILHFEKELAITPDSNQTLSDRRVVIRSKWMANSHNSISLIQAVCDTWKNGEIKADFAGGKILLNFIGQMGVPDGLDSLKLNIDDVKPAHIPFIMIFKRLLIENIHEVKTVENMGNLAIELFGCGEE